MASPVDTSVKHFTSAMLAAPVLNGSAGSLVNILDACLVTGFDIKAATSLVVASGVATLSFTGTNLAAYRSTDVASTGMYLRVDDTGTTSCRVVGYEQMTDINTGSGAFPTTAQLSGGGYWAKSGIANAVPALWTLFADSRTILLQISPYFSTGASLTSGVLRGFGDALPLRPGGDPYACLLNISTSNNVGSQGESSLDSIATIGNTYMPRAFTGLGSSIQTMLFSYTGANSRSGFDTTLGAFPSVVDGGLRLSRKAISATTVVPASPRCDLPGLYHVPHTGLIDTFRGRDVILGTGALAGRRLMAVQCSDNYGAAPGVGQHGIAFVDITGPWR
jgi:hypothetical protein